MSWAEIKKAINSNLSVPLNNIIMDWRGKSPTPFQLKTNSAALVDVVEVASGSGVAVLGAISADTTDRQARIVITVDGVELDDQADAYLAGRNNRGWYYVYGQASWWTVTGNYGAYGDSGSAPYNRYNIPTPIYIGFKTSLKIQASTSSGANIIVFGSVIA